VAETTWACRFFDTARARTPQKKKKNRADLVYLCRRETPSPLSHHLAKTLAESVIAIEGYQTKADPFFATKLTKRAALKIRWKKEWLHKPVFRKTNKVSKEESELEELCAKSHSARAAAYESVQSAKRGLFNLWEKSDDAQTAATFDNRS